MSRVLSIRAVSPPKTVASASRSTKIKRTFPPSRRTYTRLSVTTRWTSHFPVPFSALSDRPRPCRPGRPDGGRCTTRRARGQHCHQAFHRGASAPYRPARARPRIDPPDRLPGMSGSARPIAFPRRMLGPELAVVCFDVEKPENAVRRLI